MLRLVVFDSRRVKVPVKVRPYYRPDGVWIFEYAAPAGYHSGKFVSSNCMSAPRLIRAIQDKFE